MTTLSAETDAYMYERAEQARPDLLPRLEALCETLQAMLPEL